MARDAKGEYPELLSVDDVAEMLGVGVKAIRSWTAKGAIPPPKQFVGFKRWVKCEMQAWLAAGCPQSGILADTDAIPPDNQAAIDALRDAGRVDRPIDEG